jgi:hypothetical protein
MQSLRTNKILTLILVIQWAFVQLLAQYPGLVERFYSNQFYRFISETLRLLLGWIPFSVGDLLYIGFALVVIRIFYLFFKQRKWQWRALFFKLGAWCSLIYFLFHFNWGLNYHRLSLSDQLGIISTEYTTDDLVEFTRDLIIKANEVQLQLASSDTIRPISKLSKKELKKRAPLCYENLAEIYDEYTYQSPSVKHSLLSLPLTYMGFAGYLNPVTNEAQVNYMIPMSSYPATLCHEIAHQVGLGSESEANFVGYLASVHADELYYNYSGYLMALRYCLSEIYKRDPQNYEIIVGEIHTGIIKDFRESRRFWMSYQNFSEKHFKSVYDSYLKANKQKAGIDSYNNMVGLLINYYKKNTLR